MLFHTYEILVYLYVIYSFLKIFDTSTAAFALFNFIFKTHMYWVTVDLIKYLHLLITYYYYENYPFGNSINKRNIKYQDKFQLST